MMKHIIIIYTMTLLCFFFYLHKKPEWLGVVSTDGADFFSGLIVIITHLLHV